MKTKNIFLTFVLNLVFITTFAQGENNNWYFGNKAALNFSNPNPIVLNSSAMNTFESCGSVSDNNGNLLFYANSENIWNRQNQVMPNGTLLPQQINDSAEQLAIVKNPANNNQYYVFTTGQNGSSNSNFRINYSIVDMSLGPVVGGLPLGDVLPGAKNIGIIDNLGALFFSEAVTIVPHITDNSFWVLIPNGNNLYTYKIDANGFNNGNPVISNLSFPTNLDDGKHFSIKASPKILNNNYTNFICISYWIDKFDPNLDDSHFTNKVYSFNSATGQITNNFSLQINSLRAYLPEFNKNASVLFLGYKNIHAVDLINSTSSLVQSLEIYNDPASSNPPGYGYSMGIQRNVHGEIYVSRPARTFLGRIVNPDIYGANMSLNVNAVNLGNASTRYGLPQLISKYEPITYYPCIENLTLTSEPNLNFYYEIGNKITTKDKYVLGPRHNITMKAGESVNLLPGTDMQLGTNYHAFIARCTEDSTTSRISKANHNQKDMVLNLDIEERKTLEKKIDIYPNPASTFINIDSGNEKITSWELLDISGRSILKGSSNKVNVQGLPKTTYLLNININNKTTTKKVIVK